MRWPLARRAREVREHYDEQNREGGHICYISNMAKFRSHYPSSSLTRRVDNTIDEMVRLSPPRAV